MMCFGSNGKPFAILVYVRMNESIHSVLTPEFESEQSESAQTYFDFLQNNEESLQTSYCRWDRLAHRWIPDRKDTVVEWGKRGQGFDDE